MPPEPDDAIHNTMCLDLPASTKYLNVIGAVLGEILLRTAQPTPESVIHEIKLAVHEACTNIVLHAYEGMITGRLRIIITLHTDKLVVILHDTGRSFDLNAQPEPALGTAQVHGFGLYLMRNLLDKVDYRAGKGGNRWHLTKYLQEPAATVSSVEEGQVTYADDPGNG